MTVRLKSNSTVPDPPRPRFSHRFSSADEIRANRKRVVCVVCAFCQLSQGLGVAHHAVHARRGILRGVPALRREHAHGDAGGGGRPDDVEDSLLCPPWPGAPCCPFSPGQPWFNRSVACAWQAEHNVLIEGGRRDEARRLLDPPLSEVHPATSARRAALACSRHAAAVQAASLLPRCETQHRKDSSRRRRCAGTRSFQRRSMTRPWLSSAPSAGPYRCSFVCLCCRPCLCTRERALA